MRVLTIFTFVVLASAVETGPVQVLSVYDGDTLTIRADLGGETLPVKVRLLWVDTPELKGNKHGEAMPEGKAAADALKAMLPPGTEVKLWGPGETLETDQYGRVLALVFLTDGKMVNERQVAAGWSPYWRKYGDAPEPWHSRFMVCQESAKLAKDGAWGTAEKWARDKSNERTAGK